MDTLEQITVIFQKILDRQQTEADLSLLCQLLNLGQRNGFTQGKNVVGQVKGDRNQVGDRTINTDGGGYQEGDRHITNIFNLPSNSEFKGQLEHLLSGIPETSVRQAYQNFLYSDRAGDRSLWATDHNLDQIVESIVNSRDLDKFLCSLVNCLIELTQIESSNTIRRVGKVLPTLSVDPVRQFYLNSNQTETDSLEYYLLATLQPCNQNKNLFCLNAWLVKYNSKQNVSETVMSLVDETKTEIEIICQADRLPQEFNQCLKKATKHLRRERGKYPLTIEVFLPKSLMGEEIAKVDSWKIDDPVDDAIPLGTHYRVRLRSLERLQMNYLDSYLYQWQQSWHLVEDNLQNQQVQQLFEHLEDMQDFHWKQLTLKLQEKIGFKLTCAPPLTKLTDLFKAILKATTPIGIWTRYDIPNLDRVAAIDKILTSQPLCRLCETVKKVRQKADAQGEEHLGLHLVVLWENPYRLPPDVMADLSPPGQ